jgi:enamine deaminase RidA (YjgF/YER057c/UK114 family)
LIVRFDPPGGLSGDADEQVRQCVQRIQTILQAYEATLRKTDGARHEAYVDLPRKEAAAFRLRLLETPDIADARFEDVTKPADEELGEGE